MVANYSLAIKPLALVSALLILFVGISFAADAMAAYKSNTGSCPGFTTNCPKIRLWDSTGSGSWDSEVELPTSGSPLRWVVLKQSPVSDKMVLVTSSMDFAVDAFVCMSGCTNSANWQATSIGDVGNETERRFDVEFETTSGDAVFVYSTTSTNTSRDIAYMVLPAAATNFSGISPSYINDAGHGTNIQYTWLSLDRDPTSDELLLVGFDTTDSDINAWVWSGSAFGNVQEITAAANATGGTEALAVKYAADGSKGMVVGATGTTGNVSGYYWNGATWTVANIGDITADTSDVTWTVLKADPASDDLQMAEVNSGGGVATVYWNGSSWNATMGIVVGLDTLTERCFDFEWQPTGSTGKLVWDADGTGNTLSQRSCSPRCTGATSTISSYAGRGSWLSMYRNPDDSDVVNLLGVRLNNQTNEDAGSFYYNGTNFTNYGDTALTGDYEVAVPPVYESYDLAFLPSGITSCLNISASGSYELGADLVGAGIDSGPRYSGYSTCIRISADDVTLNCMGHSLTADDTYQIGIYSDGFSNITIINCSVDGDDYSETFGILLYDVDESNVSFNIINNDRWGIYLSYSDYNSLLYNNFSGNDYGVYLWESDHNQMGRNLLDDSSNMGIGGSCPFLYLWDGEGYDYYTDLAGESLGGSKFETNLYEAGIYELGGFKSENGTYRMKIREVIPESDFVDELKLAVVDVPEGYGVLNQWHNTYSDDEAPPKEFMTIKDPKAPISATDKSGNDVLAEVSGKDGVPLPMQGSEPNSVIVDFGAIDNPQYAKLVITGWTAYGTDAESPYQKNLIIETMNENGEWEEAKTFGKFTGDSRTFVFDIAGILKANDTRMRISAAYSRTNTNIMDQILLDDSEPVDIEVTYIDPSVADLRWGGSTTFEYGNTEHPHIVTDEQLPSNERFLMYGNFTKYGDVRPLLGDADDMFAIMRHGDELGLEFQDIAPVDGMDRHVFLQADVMYSIKYTTSRFVTDSIEPMPFHGMSDYPYGENESYPLDEEHLNYISTWNTREYVADPSAGMSLPYSENNTLFENVITGDSSATGVYLLWETDTKILNNNISGVWRGVYVYYSSGTVIQGNNISNNDNEGIYLYQSDNSNISYNNLAGNSRGIYLDYSDLNTIVDNNITDNDYGFYLWQSDHNQIGRNRVVNTANSNFGSCPFLFLYDGSEYEYYTDLAGEPLGVPWFKVQNYESGIYELGDFSAEEGTYKMKIREVIPESDYLDEARLVVVDVPEGYSVLNTWSYTYLSNQSPDKEFMTIKDPKAPISATDSYGNDVLAEVLGKDGVPVALVGGQQNPFILDFGSIENPEHAKLLITGWAAYGTNEGIAPQNKLIVETLGGDGNWAVAKEFGGFVGDSRTLVFDMSDVLDQDDTRVRITLPSSQTQMQVADQVLLDDSAPVEFSVAYLEPSVAELRWGGSTPYDYANTQHRHIGVKDEQHPDDEKALMSGSFTRYGDVAPLLAEADDMFAVMRHGDELLLEFEDIPQEDGTSRAVFLEADVMYTIKYSINGFVRDTIEPMPFHGMSAYPYGAGESYPYDEEHLDYVSTWNTRTYATEPSVGMSLPYSVNNTVFENVIESSYVGLSLETETDTKLLNNNISDSNTGIYISWSLNTLISGNNINSSITGIELYRCNDTNLSINTVHDSDATGLKMRSSPDTRVSRDQYYGNGVDIEANAESTDFSFYLEEVMFDNDAGLPENFTNLSLSDNLLSGEHYTLDWAAEPAAPPYPSFAQKYINISVLNSTPSIDTIIWHWTEEELNTTEYNYTESMFNIFEYGAGNWLQAQSLLDTDANTLTVTGMSGFSVFAILEGGESSGEDDGGHYGDNPLDLSYNLSCDGNSVTVTSGDDPVSNARVAVISTASPIIVFTDDEGQAEFDACGMDVKFHVSKSGYDSADVFATLLDCTECAAECMEDSDCASGESCLEGVCAVKPQCGADSDCGSGMACQGGKCMPEYECIQDSDCGAGKVCRNHVCSVPFECTKNSDCAAEKYCNIAAGAAGGSCKAVEGTCGKVVSHSFVPYQCGDEAGCPACPDGSGCVNHTCVALKYEISCPSTGVVGAKQTCTITEDGKPCVGCNYSVIGPDGKRLTGATDEDGNLALSPNKTGQYNVSILGTSGLALKTVSIQALAQPPQEQPKEPAADSTPLLLGILVILALALAAWFLVFRKKQAAKKK